MGEVIYLFKSDEEEVRPISLYQPDLRCRGCGRFAPFEVFSREYHIRVPFCGNREYCWPRVLEQIKEMKQALKKIKDRIQCLPHEF